MRHRTWEEMKARGWNRAFHAAHGNTLIELLFLVVGMLVLSVSRAASAKEPSALRSWRPPPLPAERTA